MARLLKILKMTLLASVVVPLLVTCAAAANIEFTTAGHVALDGATSPSAAFASPEAWTYTFFAFQHATTDYSSGGGIFDVTQYSNALLGYKQDAASGAAGVGVRSGNLPDFDGGGQGEIDPGQALAIIFSQPVYLTSFTVNFLYNEFTPNPNIIEGGQYALLFPFAVGPFPFSQTNPLELFSGVGTEPGSLVVSTFHGLPIAGIVFYSSGTTQHDYVVRSIDASSTPEPGSMLLLGSGLLGLVGLRRRMRRK